MKKRLLLIIIIIGIISILFVAIVAFNNKKIFSRDCLNSLTSQREDDPLNEDENEYSKKENGEIDYELYKKDYYEVTNLKDYLIEEFGPTEGEYIYDSFIEHGANPEDIKILKP